MSSILFVCTGNICRSPSAEALLRHRLDHSEHKIDSAGTHDYHIGSRPSKEALKILDKKNVSTEGIVARKVEERDFSRFDYIIAMDEGHFDILQSIQPQNAKAKLSFFSDYCTSFKSKDVPDPYYGGPEDYQIMMDILEDGMDEIVKLLSVA